METHGKMPLNISSSKFFRAIANAFFLPFCRFGFGFTSEASSPGGMMNLISGRRIFILANIIFYRLRSEDGQVD